MFQSACELPQLSPFADELAQRGVPYLRLQRTFDGENSQEVNVVNYSDHTESRWQTANEAARYKLGGNVQRPEKDESGIPEYTTSREVIPGGAVVQQNGFTGTNAAEVSQSPTGIAKRVDNSGVETKEAATVLTRGEVGETPGQAKGILDVKEDAPSAKDIVNAKGKTTPRKISFMDKIRGEIKVLVGKLGNNQDKIVEGKKMMRKDA